MRVILFTGKGGVGKTTISAATALKSASLGYKTLTVSTDQAHSLSDSFGINIGSEMKMMGERLWVQEIDIHREIEENWGEARDFYRSFLLSQGFDEVVAEEFTVLPGMEELFSLLCIKRYFEEKEFDVIIVDCAPTGETVRLLSFPDIMKWYMERIFNIEKRVIPRVRPVLERILKVPLPDREVYSAVERMYKNVLKMHRILTDGDITTIRLVINPEKMVIKEAQRAYACFNLFGFCCDAVIANRIMPGEVEDIYFRDWKGLQKMYLDEAEAVFHPLPIFQAKLFPREIVGVELLRELGDYIYGDRDPVQIFLREKPFVISKRGSSFILSIKMPLTEKKDLEIWTKGEELIIKLRNVRRNILLPRALVNLDVEKATLEEGVLRIFFKGGRG